MYEHVSKKTPRFLFVSLPCRISLPWIACHHLLPSFLLLSWVLDKATFIVVTSTVQKRRAVWGGPWLAVDVGGGVSELGADGWHWVCLDGEFPNSKSAGLVKSLTDCSQLKRCTDVFVMFLLIPNLTSWSTRSHIWLCSKIPMAFLFRARKRHQGGRWDTVALLSLGCTASRGQPCCGLVGTEADETWKYGIFPKLI